MHQPLHPADQGEHVTSRYPVSQVIEKIIRNTGYTPFGFLLALGHPGTEAVLPDLESWLEKGEGQEGTVALIAGFDPDEADNLHEAAAETAAMKAAGVDPVVLERTKREQAERDSFRPFIHVEGESTVPNGITIFAMTGGHHRWTTVQLPGDILKLTLEEQLERVPKLMTDYKLEHKGCCPFFGYLVGFKFVCWSEYFQFDADGQLLGCVEKAFRPAPAWVELR